MESRSAATFEDGFNNKALTHGRVLINQLAILLKVAQMHDLQNVAVVKAAESLAGTVGHFLEDRKSFSVYLFGEYFFLEDNRIKYNVEDFSNFDYLAGEFKLRKLGAVSFNETIDSAELVAFASAFLKTDTGAEDPYRSLMERLGGAGVSGLATGELKPPKEDDGFERVVDTVKAARQAYVRTVLRVRNLFDGVEAGQPADIRKLKRSVQALVDSVYRNEPVLMRLSAIRRDEKVLPRHYTNVCVLSLGVCKRLGFSKYQMSRIGMAALLHDIGRVGIPGNILDMIETDMEAVNTLKGHARRGVDTMLGLKGLNDVAISAMIVAYEHHRNLDGSGYPDIIENKEMNIFSRVVRVCDHYDLSTSAGVYGKFTQPPHRVIAEMIRHTGDYFDEEVMNEFVRMMGVYPPGTLLSLTDGSLAVSIGPGSGPGGAERPRVVPVKIAEGGRPYAGDVADLSAVGEGIPGISEPLDALRAGLNVYRYLV